MGDVCGFDDAAVEEDSRWTVQLDRARVVLSGKVMGSGRAGESLAKSTMCPVMSTTRRAAGRISRSVGEMEWIMGP